MISFPLFKGGDIWYSTFFFLLPAKELDILLGCGNIWYIWYLSNPSKESRSSFGGVIFNTLDLMSNGKGARAFCLLVAIVDILERGGTYSRCLIFTTGNGRWGSCCDGPFGWTSLNYPQSHAKNVCPRHCWMQILGLWWPIWWLW